MKHSVTIHVVDTLGTYFEGSNNVLFKKTFVFGLQSDGAVNYLLFFEVFEFKEDVFVEYYFGRTFLGLSLLGYTQYGSAYKRSK